MAVTIKDVAKAAGVATATVSRAFNNYADILPETRERVRKVADKLGYSPNLSARNLSAKSTDNIGLIVSGFLDSNDKDNIVFLLLQGIYTYTSNHHIQVALHAIDSEAQRQKSYTQFCTEHNLSGAILSGVTTNDAYFHELLNNRFNCVTFDISMLNSSVGCVSTDNVQASTDMADYIFACGHRDIMIVAGKKNSTVNLERMTGAHTSFAAHGITLTGDRVIYSDFSEKIACEKVSAYIREHGKNGATAFMCFSDMTAIGAMKAIALSGYRVPEDFSVTGFDGLPITEYISPPLTTVWQDIKQCGYACAEMLHGMISGKDGGCHKFIPHKLLKRGTVKKINIRNEAQHESKH